MSMPGDVTMILGALSIVGIVGSICLTVRSCWRSRDHRANVARVCSSFDLQGLVAGRRPGDLASALSALRDDVEAPAPTACLHPHPLRVPER